MEAKKSELIDNGGCAAELNLSDCSCFECDTIRCFTQKSPKPKEDIISKTCLFLSKKTFQHNNNKSEVQSKDISDIKHKTGERKTTKGFEEYDINEWNGDETQTVRKRSNKMMCKSYNNTDNPPISTEEEPLADDYTTAAFHPNSGRAELSAQIMNLPYQNVKESISCNKSSDKVAGKLSKYDIIKRIREVYKACSCKVCECLAAKTPSTKINCKCRPCECPDCQKVALKFSDILGKTIGQNKSQGSDYSDIGCARSDRIKSAIKKYNFRSCNCTPCACIKCARTIPESCSCMACQCIQCKSMQVPKSRTIIVAPVGEDHQRPVCGCDPCDCAECVHGSIYPLPTNIMHEMSTGMTRNAYCHCENCRDQMCAAGGTDDCVCDRPNKAIRKPVERDTHDYDIRQATIKNHIRFKNKDNTNERNHDTLALFAAVPNSYLKYSHNKKACTCDECQCILSKCKDEQVPTIKMLKSSQKALRSFNFNENDCACVQCECEICKENNNNIGSQSLTQNNTCKCEICECIDCKGMVQPSTSTKYYKNNYSVKRIGKIDFKTNCCCKPCDCADCKHIMIKCAGDVCECSHCKCEKCVEQKQKTNDYADFIYRSSKNDNESSKADVSVFKVFPQCNKSIRIDDTPHVLKKHDYLLKCDAYTQFEETNKNKYSNSTRLKISESYISAISGLTKPSKTSYYNDSILGEPSERKTVSPSGESSCNSSGHDNPDYLIKFPRTTVEDCLNEVLNLNYKGNLNFDRLNIISNTPTSYQFLSPVSNDYMNKSNANIDIEMRKQSTSKDSSNVKKNYNPRETIIETCNILKNKCTKKDSNQICETSKTSQSDIVRLGNHKLIINDHRESTKASSVSLQRNSPTSSCSKYPNFTNNTFKYQQIVNENCSDDDYKMYNLTTTADIAQIHIDYERAHKTLREARAFSQHLLKLLENYEKANREFQSISQKLIVTHELVMNWNVKPVEQPRENSQFECCKKEMQNNYVNNNDNNVRKNDFPYSIGDSKKNIDQKPSVVFHHFNKVNAYKETEKLKQNLEIDNKQHTLVPGSSISKLCNIENSKSCHVSEEKIVSTLDRNSNESKISICNFSAITEHSNEELGQLSLSLNIGDNSKQNEKISLESSKADNTANEQKTVTTNSKTSLHTNETQKESIISKGPVFSDIHEQNELLVKELLPQIIKQVDSVYGSSKKNLNLNRETKTHFDINVASTGIATVYGGLEASEIQENLATAWSPLKKNYCLNIDPSHKMQTQRGCGLALMEKETKLAVQSISLQTNMQNIFSKSFYQNVALANLHKEVKKLSNMPILQTSNATLTSDSYAGIQHGNPQFELNPSTSSQTYRKPIKVEKEIDTRDQEYAELQRQFKHVLDKSFMRLLPQNSDISKLTGLSSKSVDMRSKSSCESQKVSFLGVRRVSDHTVLVKWNAPRAMADVQGYELLVDGRPVQKIFSPSRCMAVVTCLPHCEKVLLTIKTLVATSSKSGHYPSTTIVYHPRLR